MDMKPLTQLLTLATFKMQTLPKTRKPQYNPAELTNFGRLCRVLSNSLVTHSSSVGLRAFPFMRLPLDL